MADAHGHLGHELIAVVQHQAEESPLLGCGDQTKEAAQTIAQAVEAEVRPAGPHVADQIAAAILEPVLQPGRNDLGLDVEFVEGLLLAVLLGGAAAQDLHGFAGHPVVLEQVAA